MSMHRPLSLAALVVLLCLASSPPAPAKNKACAGVSKKCTTDTTYDKTIDGTAYSCYDCKQVLCKNDGNGGISGTSTSSVCTEKATTFQPTSTDSQFGGHDRMAPERRPRPRPTNTRRPHNNETSPVAAPKTAPVNQRKPHKPAPVSKGARADSGSNKRESATTGTLSFDEADALFGKRTTARSTKPAKPAATPTPRSEPGPTPPGTTIAYPAHSE